MNSGDENREAVPATLVVFVMLRIKKTTRKYIQSNDKHTKQPPLITVSIDTTSQTLCDTTSLAKKTKYH